MLDGRIERKLMLVFFPKQIITQSATIDNVLGLFGDIRFVRLQIKFIPSAAELIRGMYNPQIEMFARFKMKSSFHKTKRII